MTFLRKSIAISLFQVTWTLLATAPVAAVEIPTKSQSETDSHLVLTVEIEGRETLFLIDKTSGVLLVGDLRAPGVGWGDPLGLSLPGVDDAAYGLFGAEGEPRLALASREANRVQMIDPFEGRIPRAAFTEGVGPSAVAPIDPENAADPDATDGLLLGTALNGSTDPGTLETLSHQGGDGFRTEDVEGLPWRVTALRRLLPTSGGRMHIGLIDNGMDARVFLAHAANGGVSIDDDRLVAPNSRFIAGAFTGDRPGEVALYQPGRSSVTFIGVEADGGAFRFTEPTDFDLGAEIETLSAAELDGDPHLLAVVDNGREALLIKLDDLSDLRQIDSLAAGGGSPFLAGASDAAGNLLLLRGDPETTGPAQWDAYGLNDGQLSRVASGGIPDLDIRAPFVNVLLFNGEPFVDNAAQLLVQLQAGEWTTGADVESGIVQLDTSRTITPSKGLEPVGRETLSPIPQNATDALVNQYARAISLSSGDFAPRVATPAIQTDPSGGVYRASIAVTLSSPDPALDIFYRRESDAPWREYIQPVWIVDDTTLEYHGRADGRQTPVFTAEYVVDVDLEDADSDGDGVPDFVEAAHDLDPAQSGADGDGDGVGDLEELMAGTDPTDENDRPSEQERDALTQYASFSVGIHAETITRQLDSREAFVDGTAVGVYTPTGEVLAKGETLQGLPGISESGVNFRGLSVDDPTGLYTVRTPTKFKVDSDGTDEATGRELLYLAPLPDFSRPEVNFSYGGGPLDQAASQWIEAARQAYENEEEPFEEVVLDPVDTLFAALVEEKVNRALAANGLDSDPRTSLFPQRAGDRKLARLSAARIDSLANASIAPLLLPAMTEALADELDPGNVTSHSNLKELAKRLYQINATVSSGKAADFTPPFDALRAFVDNGALPTPYSEALGMSEADMSRAQQSVSTILGAHSGRQFETLPLVVDNESFAGRCSTLRLVGTEQRFSLFTPDGDPFDLTEAFSLPEGAELRVDGYSDRSFTACSGEPFEVKSVRLMSIPAPSPDDADGNLLADSWEAYFGGSSGLDPFANNDGSGYSNLQQFLEGTNPNDPTSIPQGEIQNLSPPVVTIEPDDLGGFSLSWNYPASYANSFTFDIRETHDLRGGFTDTSISPNAVGGGRFSTSLPPAPEEKAFYRIILRLNEETAIQP